MAAPPQSSLRCRVPTFRPRPPQVEPTPTWKKVVLSVTSVLALLPYVIGIAFLWLAWLMQGCPAAPEKSAIFRTPRTKGSNPLINPPKIWF